MEWWELMLVLGAAGLLSGIYATLQGNSRKLDRILAELERRDR